MQMDAFDFFAFIAMGLLVAVGVCLIVILGSLPGKVATRRNHPQAEAIAAAGWISLVTLGALWPIALVWAYTTPGIAGSNRTGGSNS